MFVNEPRRLLNIKSMSGDSPLHLLINSTVQSTTVIPPVSSVCWEGNPPWGSSDSQWLSYFFYFTWTGRSNLTHRLEFLFSFFLCLLCSHLLSFPLLTCPRHGASIKLNCQVWLSQCFLSLDHFSRLKWKVQLHRQTFVCVCARVCVFKTSKFDWNDWTLSWSTSLPLHEYAGWY